MGELLMIYSVLAVFRMPLQDNYYFWKTIGFAGLGVFQARWIVQWIYSEKHGESRMPIAFWWLSLTGAALELCYFLRQQDSVGVAGYFFSVVPYTRNLMLIYSKRRRLQTDAATGAASSGALGVTGNGTGDGHGAVEHVVGHTQRD